MSNNKNKNCCEISDFYLISIDAKIFKVKENLVNIMKLY